MALRPTAFLLILAFFASAVAVSQNLPGNHLELVDRAVIATGVYTSIKMRFGHWRALPDFDLEEEYRNYLQQALGNDDRRAFDLATIAFVAKLRNGHSGFGDRWLWDNDGQQLGFYAYPVEGRWTVTRSEVPGLTNGGTIETIDGENFEQFFKRNAVYVSASDERWARRAFFEYTYLFPRRFILGLSGGLKVSVTRDGKHQWAGQEYDHIEVKTRPNLTYIRIPSFAKSVFEQEALDAIEKADARKALIIDIRGNHGGSTPEKLMSALMDRPYRWWAESTPLLISVLDYQAQMGKHAEAYWYGDVTQPTVSAYKGRLLLLIDGGCFSACEDFAVSFKDNHRAVLIGEQTAGSSGQPFAQDFSNGMSVGLSTKREFFPNGAEFEGVGIAPDVEVKLTIDDLKQGKDAILRRAEVLAQGLP